jgi:branched-chain amino acid transport system permease protein
MAAVVAVNALIMPFLDAYVSSIVIYAGVNIILAVSLNLVNGFTGQFSMGHAGFMAVGAYTSAFISQKFQIAFPEATGFVNALLFLAALMAGGILASAVGYLEKEGWEL